MKKFILNLSALLCLSVTAAAQTITVADVEALPGETVTATLNLTAPVETYTGVQFAIQFPAEGFSIATTGAVSGWNGSLEYGSMNVGKVKFAAAASRTFETATIAVEFTVGETVALASYDVTVTDIVFEGAGAKNSIDDVGFKVNVVAAHTVVLDENSTTAPSEAAGVNVRVLRTISAGEWSTICLPFAMTAAQVKAAFGDDVQLANFNSWSSEEDDDGNIAKLELGFTEVMEIEANTPCIIKTSGDISEFSVDGVDIEVDEEPTVQVGKKKAERGYFIGTYAAGITVPENNLFLSGNKFWYSVGNTKMKAFRAYFELADVLTSVEEGSYSSRITMSFNGGKTTGISRIEDGGLKMDNCVYDLQGRCMESSMFNVQPSMLKKGIYIVNGKKVIK